MIEKIPGRASASFEPAEHLVIVRTEHWVLNHRVGSALPGYLMLGARARTNELSQLPPDALAQLGGLLAEAQKALTVILQPQHIYIGRYGHSAGHTLHFHLIPICGWVRQLFFDDSRYRVLERFCHATAPDADSTDGAELTLFVWREFCESPSPPRVSGPTVAEVVRSLRAILA